MTLPPDVVQRLTQALCSAGRRECGGVLMGEHVGPDHYVVRDISVHQKGSVASFVRELPRALAAMWRFFAKTSHQYTKYNYLGEWHSHPSFAPEPSSQDHQSMFDIVNDSDVGANFAVLLVVKLNESGHLVGSAHTYLPGGTVLRSDLLIERRQ